MVNRITGEPSSQLHERHDASDFDTRHKTRLRRDERARCGSSLCFGREKALGLPGMSACHTAVPERCRPATWIAPHGGRAARLPVRTVCLTGEAPSRAELE